MRPLRTLSLTSWFRIPEQGMKQFDVLSRASATAIVPVDTKRGAVTEVSVVSCLHILYPFLYPHYYPQQMEWLSFVGPQHVRCSLEARDEKGETQHAWAINHLFHHHNRDLVALKFSDADEQEAIKTLEANDMLYKFGDGDPNKPVSFVGHELNNDPASEGYQVPELVISNPSKLPQVGHVAQRSRRKMHASEKDKPETFNVDQFFIATNKVLEMGMCGGPAVASGDVAEDDFPVSVGMVEGVVENEENKGFAAVIPQVEIASMLTGVEEGMAARKAQLAELETESKS